MEPSNAIASCPTANATGKSPFSNLYNFLGSKDTRHCNLINRTGGIAFNRYIGFTAFVPFFFCHVDDPQTVDKMDTHVLPSMKRVLPRTLRQIGGQTRGNQQNSIRHHGVESYRAHAWHQLQEVLLGGRTCKFQRFSHGTMSCRSLQEKKNCTLNHMSALIPGTTSAVNNFKSITYSEHHL